MQRTTLPTTASDAISEAEELAPADYAPADRFAPVRASRAVVRPDRGRDRHKLTEPAIKALKPGQQIWDAAVPGFGCRRRQGAASYFLKFRFGGRQEWFTIGKHGSGWNIAKARKEARRLLGQVADGVNPATERRKQLADPTVKELGALFLEQHVTAKRKTATQAMYTDLLQRVVYPKLGTLKVATVTRADVSKMHLSARATPYQANRAVAVVSALFTWAERHGYRADGSNPARHVERFKEQARERFLNGDELARLGEALAAAARGEPMRRPERKRRKPVNPDKIKHRPKKIEVAAENRYAIAALRLLIFTGARMNEILTLQWAHVDFERQCLRLPDSKTGAKVIHLSAPALAVLQGLPREDKNPHVIVGERTGQHFVGLKRVWQRVRHHAELAGVRLHDLRHSFASVAASGGLSLPMIGKLLGHTQAATTQRYAHLAVDPVKQAGERVAQQIAAAMEGKPKANVVDVTVVRRVG